VLRTETAALTVLSALQLSYGDLAWINSQSTP
jgi:hypothetical protein